MQNWDRNFNYNKHHQKPQATGDRRTAISSSRYATVISPDGKRVWQLLGRTESANWLEIFRMCSTWLARALPEPHF